MKNIFDKISMCCQCDLWLLEMNKKNEEKGYGKLFPFFKDSYKNKIMLVGLNPSYRRFPGIYQAFGGEIESEGTGWKFISLLKELNLLDKIYLTNLIKCSCLNNEPPKMTYHKCFKIFQKEVEIIEPPLIVALGNNVYSYLKNNINIPLKKIHHPNYWSSYLKITKKQYSQELLNICQKEFIKENLLLKNIKKI